MFAVELITNNLPFAHRTALLCLIILFTTGISHAQFTGGAGDGHETQETFSTSLDGAPTGVSSLYRGGTGDGVDFLRESLTLNGALLTELYGGGQGDGFDANLSQLTLAGTSLSLLYGGGSGDGFDNLAGTFTLNGAGLTMLYGGGSGDGFDEQRVTRTLSGVSLAQVFGGGAGDGFDAKLINTSLGGTMFSILYGGGPGDGFDALRYSSTLAGQPLATLYGGGQGDGADVFRLDGGVIALPLTLITFAAIPHEKFVLLKWVTEDELDTDYFTIEKTADGASFVDVADVEAAGFSESGERLHYETKDHNPYEGTSYYRLATTDFDGTITLSHLIEVQYASATDWDFTAFPNPNTGRHLNIRAEGAAEGAELTLSVFDAAGRRVLNRSYRHTPGASERFDLQQRLPAGTYLLRLQQVDGTYQAKLLIVGGVQP